MKWLSETYDVKIENISNRIFVADSRFLSRCMHEKIDGIATEPMLLPPLKRFPSEEEADDMLQRARTTYAESLPEMTNVLKKGGRLVLVVPFIRTAQYSELSFSLEDVFKKLGLALYLPRNYPQLEYPLRSSSDKDQKVLRGVYVLEKL